MEILYKLVVIICRIPIIGIRNGVLALYKLIFLVLCPFSSVLYVRDLKKSFSFIQIVRDFISSQNYTSEGPIDNEI